MIHRNRGLLLCAGLLLMLGGLWVAQPQLAADPAGEVAALQVGDTAPDFTLPGTGGKKYSLSGYAGKQQVILVFYPKDFTSVCTKQLCQMRDDFSALTELDAVIFGINNNPLDSHEKFKAEHEYPFPLLTDADLSVAASYGAARPGQAFVDRTVVIIGKDGKVRFYARGVPSTDDLLAALKGEAPDA